MHTRSSTQHCPFDHAEALEFDPTLQRFLDEEPVARVRLPYGEEEAWLVTGYDDVRTVTTDRRFSRSAVIGRDFPRMTPEPIVQAEAINVMDPPVSSRLRRLVAKGFAPRQIARMRPRIQSAVDELLDGMERRPAAADLVERLTGPLPLLTICDILEIPAADQAGLRAHARTMMDVGLDNRAAAVRAKAELRSYFTELTARRRADPGDDLISVLAAARDGDELLDDDELAVMAMVLLITGQDTTMYQLGNISFTLLTRPALAAALRERPGELRRTLDELLRLIPFRKGVGIPRVATEDVELSGVTIRAGDIVHVSYLTANRDARKFERPDELDTGRAGPSHMTFGWGAHHCLGAPLAQAEIEIAIGTLLRRFPRLTLARPAGEVEWNRTSIWRYPLALPVTW
ncbi:cytochrome P450 [Streptomyces uncialis]|uniref:Cytochrome P450 n=1 Tax=Streptomyces uncialis TaxID=1048205 RepID=A0A1Q4V7R2_9ACTN|nr:cytochrome P450 [Streptomyces uncialis]OKH93770.1 cytochrome P450 [Streptomyces uncialis]